MATLIGQTVSHYTILEHLGSGGMGVVYRAEDIRLKRTVALKFLHPELTTELEAKGRFIHEAQAASAMDHPNVCTVYEIDETEDGQSFMAMACYDGETLKAKIARGPVPVDVVFSVLSQVAEGLASAHERGIIHRDIKPANIILTKEGVAKIVDFGLATLSNRSLLTKTRSTVGTVAYMSPEQARGETVDHRTDLWSLGVVMYEMLTGRVPFAGDHEQAVIYLILNADPHPIEQRVPAGIAQILARALRKGPASRYQSAEEMLHDLRRCRESLGPAGAEGAAIRTLSRMLRRPSIAIPVLIGTLAGIAIASWHFDRQSKVRWARETAIPAIEKMVTENDVWRNLVAPYRLAERAEAILGEDSTLTRLFQKCAVTMNVRTKPPGASVFMKEYADTAAAWDFLGNSPLDSVRVPVGIFRWMFAKEGYDTVFAAASTWSIVTTERLFGSDMVRTLHPKGESPQGMVQVESTRTPLGTLGPFLIGRCEVTNREYKRFVDAGGYRERRYWKHIFVHGGRQLPWEEAVRSFTDRSAQPGPSTWLGGDYPRGRGEHPVSGVSWYEAAAYAEFAGKSLPTDLHWNAARGGFEQMLRRPQLGGFSIMAPFCNFAGAGTVPVGSLSGVTSFGAHDMAGNVREWCWNKTQQGRLLRGGAWDDNTYEFANQRQAPPMDRSPKNGIRLALFPARAGAPDTAFAPLQLGDPIRFREMRPVSDAIFQVYREQFAYDRTDLNAIVEEREDHPEGWTHERVTFDAAYAGERVLAHLFLPSNARPPYQTVIYFPGSSPLLNRSNANIEGYYEFPLFLSFLVRSGRAVVFPVYMGTFGRGDPSLRTQYIEIHSGSEKRAYTAYLVQLVKDFRRCLDYLETRTDIDTGKLAYYGVSWGGILGGIIPAVEDRLRAVVLVAGGACRNARPEGSSVNYVPRIRIPTLMLNGKYDTIFEVETRVKPMFDLLGTPAEHKRLILYETDHLPPRTEYIKETLAWLDRYLGPTH
jgi:tRNA A-37 threonylcarbamoyl transferase component Bud32